MRKLIHLFSNHERNEIVLYQFIKLLQVKVTITSVSDRLLTHPDYPSLLSISDTLSFFQIHNVSVECNHLDLSEIEPPFIAIIQTTDTKYVLVEKVVNDEVKYYDGNRRIIDTTQNFVDKWSRIILLAVASKNSGEKDFTSKNRKEYRKLLVAPIFLLIGLAVAIVVQATENKLKYERLTFILLSVVQWIGVATTGILLWYEIDKNKTFLQTICTGVKKTDCAAVLDSSGSKVFGVSWSEIGFFYFIFGFLSTILFSENPEFEFGFLSYFNVIALPYVLFSLYYQWRIVKQWCILCLSVQALLLSEFLIFFMSKSSYNFSFRNDVFSHVPLILTIILTTVGTWVLIKPRLIEGQRTVKYLQELQRFKFNREIFKTLLEKQRTVKYPSNGLGIWLGNEAAANVLIKVCHPYCKYCSDAHLEIEELLANDLNLKVQIIFKVTNEDNDIAALPVKHLLAIDEKNAKSVTYQALNRWYATEKKIYNDFYNYYPVNGDLSNQRDKVSSMSKWCADMNILGTPTFFFNGYELPSMYSITDLKYFLQQ